MRETVEVSCHTGSRRHMTNLFHDSMAILNELGRNDYFITFTTNMHWPEIKKAMGEFQKPWERPEVVNRVFKMTG